MTSYRVELKSLKSWRSGNLRFTKGIPHILPEDKAAAFMHDGHFTVTKVESPAKEADKVAKGVVKEAPVAEQVRQADKPRQDLKREGNSEFLKPKPKKLKVEEASE